MDTAFGALRGALSDVELNIPGFKPGSTGKEIADALLKQNLQRNGLSGNILPTSKEAERKTLEDRLIESQEKAQLAAEKLAENASTQQQQFLDGLKAQFDRFFDVLGANTAKQTKEAVVRRRTETQARLSETSGPLAAARSLTDRFGSLAKARTFAGSGQLQEFRRTQTGLNSLPKADIVDIRQLFRSGANASTNFADRSQVADILKNANIELPPDLFEKLFKPISGQDSFGTVTNNFQRLVPEIKASLQARAAEQKSNLVDRFGTGIPRTEKGLAEFDKQLESVQGIKSLAEVETKFQSLSKNLDELNQQIANLNTTINKPQVGQITREVQSFFAKGGPVFTPHGTDTVPAMLTPGEFVINRQSSAKYRSTLQAINANRFQRGGVVQHFQDGGQVRAIGGGSFGLDDKSRTALTNFGQVFANNIVNLQTAFTGFSSSVSALAGSLNGIISQIPNLAKSFSIPDTITLNGTQTVEVRILGAEVLAQLQPSIEQMIVERTNEAIQKFTGERVNTSLPSSR